MAASRFTDVNNAFTKSCETDSFTSNKLPSKGSICNDFVVESSVNSNEVCEGFKWSDNCKNACMTLPRTSFRVSSIVASPNCGFCAAISSRFFSLLSSAVKYSWGLKNKIDDRIKKWTQRGGFFFPHTSDLSRFAGSRWIQTKANAHARQKRIVKFLKQRESRHE